MKEILSRQTKNMSDREKEMKYNSSSNYTNNNNNNKSEHSQWCTGQTTAFLLLTSLFSSQYVVQRVLFSWSLV